VEGNERLILRRPDAETQDSYGQPRNIYTDIVVYARRQDRGGREGVYNDTRGGQWQTRFEIRATPGLMNVSEDWGLFDGYGNEHNLEAVIFAPYWGGRRFLWLYAVRVDRKV